MLKLTSMDLNLTSGTIVCTIVCSILGQSGTLLVPINEADLITFNGGVAAWTEVTIQRYLGSFDITVSL